MSGKGPRIIFSSVYHTVKPIVTAPLKVMWDRIVCISFIFILIF